MELLCTSASLRTVLLVSVKSPFVAPALNVPVNVR